MQVGKSVGNSVFTFTQRSADRPRVGCADTRAANLIWWVCTVRRKRSMWRDFTANAGRFVHRIKRHNWTRSTITFVLKAEEYF